MFPAQLATTTAASGVHEYAVTVFIAASAEIRPTEVAGLAPVTFAYGVQIGVRWSRAFGAANAVTGAGDLVSIDTAERGVYADHIFGRRNATGAAATLGSDSAFF